MLQRKDQLINFLVAYFLRHWLFKTKKTLSIFGRITLYLLETTTGNYSMLKGLKIFLKSVGHLGFLGRNILILDNAKMLTNHLKYIKGALSGLRQFLTTESPLKMMKNAFYFILKVLFVLKTFKFLS